MKNVLLSTLFALLSLGIHAQEAYPTYGDDFDHTESLALQTIVAALDQYDGQTVTVIGDVSSVCQVKGCWMTLQNTTTEQEVQVTFKDYGFFVPTDLTGTVVIRGEVREVEIPVDELRHYAEDAGKSKEEIDQITEPRIDIRIVAEGVKTL